MVKPLFLCASLLVLSGASAVHAEPNETAPPVFALREMDMHLHAGLERQVPMQEWVKLAKDDGRKVLLLLDHIELYRKTANEYADWAKEENVPQWYPIGTEGHRALFAEMDAVVARHKDLVVFKGWEVGEFELEEGLESEAMKLAEVIGWHISPNRDEGAPDGKHLIRRISQIKEVQKLFPVPMIIFHPFSMRFERLVRDAQKAGRDAKSLTVEQCRFFQPGEQEEVVRLLKGSFIYIEMPRGVESFWDVPAMREALIADIKPLAEGGVKFTVSTDNHGVASAKKPFHPERYCEPCGITPDNANAIVHDLLARKNR